DYELVLRVWEIKSLRERKVFTTRWTPATVERALTQAHSQMRAYMEWSPASAAYAYTVPTQPRGWLDTLSASLNLFLVEKAILPPAALLPAENELRAAARRAPSSEADSL